MGSARLQSRRPVISGTGNVDGPDSPHHGRGAWTWYTGSAAWLHRIVAEWILGVRPEWDYLVRFEGDGSWATISFDLDQNVAHLTGWEDRLVAISPRTAEGLQTFFAEQFNDGGETK